MLGIMAGMKQKDSYVVSLRPRSSLFLTVACAWLVLQVTMHLTLLLTFLCRKLRIFSKFQFVDMVVDIPVGTQRPFFHGPDYSADHRDSPVALVQGGRCPCCAGPRGILDKVVHVPVVVHDSAVVDVPVAQVHVEFWTRLFTCPLLFTTVLWSMSLLRRSTWRCPVSWTWLLTCPVLCVFLVCRQRTPDFSAVAAHQQGVRRGVAPRLMS